ncbi:hypothetical protein [Pseudofulvibacter geojedonensis]|uniref:Uncharacterized protein n=1 Tax=Pseudofulvibacter geojedonensis TaxID=1123758 RepID=A0ABW3I268_9FLAO
MRHFYFLFSIFITIGIYAQENEQEKLSKDLYQDTKALKKAYYEQLKNEHDTKSLEVYTQRKNESVRKFLNHKTQTLKQLEAEKNERIEIQENIADNRNAKRIALSDEVELKKITRKNYHQKMKALKKSKKVDLKKSNSKKIEERLEKKEADYKSNKQAYKSKIDKRRQQMLIRYTIN